MKLEFNKKYTLIAVYACLIILFTIVCVYYIINIESLQSLLSGLFTILSPIFYGAIIAYILNPILRFFETKVFISRECRSARRAARLAASVQGIRNKDKIEKMMQNASSGVRQEKHTKKVNTSTAASASKAHPKLLDTISSIRKGKSSNGVRALSLLCTYFIFLILITAMLSVVIPQLIDSGKSIYNNAKTIISSFPSWIAMYKNKYEWFGTAYDWFTAKIDISSFDAMAKKLFDGFFSNINTAFGIAGAVITQIKNILFGIIFSVYFLACKEFLLTQFVRILDALSTKRASAYVKHIFITFDNKFGKFLQGKMLDSFIVACICFVVFGLFDIPYYQFIAILVGFTNMIPFFGPFIGAIPSGLIILIANPSKLILFIILVLIIQQIDGNFIDPKIIGDTIGMKPIWIMIAIIIMGGLFGLFGMFFGVPIFAVIYTLISEAVNKRLAIKYAAEVVAESAPVDFAVFLKEKDESFNAAKNDSASAL